VTHVSRGDLHGGNTSRAQPPRVIIRLEISRDHPGAQTIPEVHGGSLDERGLAGARRRQHIQYQETLRLEVAPVPFSQPIVLVQDRLVDGQGAPIAYVQIIVGMRVGMRMVVVVRMGVIMVVGMSVVSIRPMESVARGLQSSQACRVVRGTVNANLPDNIASTILTHG
jgi:hypothetical protein